MRALLLVVVMVLGACVDTDALRQSKANVAINRAHEADEKLPRQARAIAQDTGDAWEAQAKLNDSGYEVSPEAQARSKARQGAGE